MVIDPENKIDEILDILIEDSKIVKVSKDIKVEPDKEINAQDKIVMPGLVDMHVHLREPGQKIKKPFVVGQKQLFTEE